MATTSKKVTITLSHYTTYYDPKRPNLSLERVFKENPLRWSGTIIYGQIEGVPRSNPGVSDFRIAIVDDLEGRHGGGIQTQIYEEDVLRPLGVKTAILKEAKRRIALFRKAVKAGKNPSAREKFTVMATPPKARSSIPVIPAMRGFSFLTGDANWKEYGGTFYRSFGDGTYALIEFINLRDAVSYGNIRGNKYAVVGRTVDLSPGGFSLRNLDSALRTIGASPATRNPKVILDAVNVYGAFDVDFEIFGNNADKLMADAKRRY